MSSKTLYEILGISINATQEEVKQAYRRQAMKWHPDRNLDNRAEAEKKFKEISHAYSILSDILKRQEYDQWLQGSTDANQESEDSFTEENSFDVFISLILDIAFDLAEKGADQISIYRTLVDEGCPESTAQTVAKRAYEMASRVGQAPENKKNKFDHSNEKDNETDIPPKSKSKSADLDPNKSSPAGPWSRWLARAFDLMVANLILLTIVFFLISDWSQFKSLRDAPIEAIFLFVIWGVFVFTMDAVIVGIFSNSIGKALFRIQVKNKADNPIDFTEAWSRNFSIYILGLWGGIPFVCLIPQYLAFLKLKQTGSTNWDKSYSVEQKHVGLGRGLGITLGFFILWMMWSSVSAVLASKMAQNKNIPVEKQVAEIKDIDQDLLASTQKKQGIANISRIISTNDNTLLNKGVTNILGEDWYIAYQSWRDDNFRTVLGCKFGKVCSDIYFAKNIQLMSDETKAIKVLAYYASDGSGNERYLITTSTVNCSDNTIRLDTFCLDADLNGSCKTDMEVLKNAFSPFANDEYDKAVKKFACS